MKASMFFLCTGFKKKWSSCDDYFRRRFSNLVNGVFVSKEVVFEKTDMKSCDVCDIIIIVLRAVEEQV